MIGLIYKDLCNLKRYMMQLLIIVVVMSILFTLQGNGGVGFLSSYCILLCTMVVISSISYDDLAKWDKYALTMPLSRKTLVGSKYLLGLLCAAAGAVLALVLTAVAGLFKRSSDSAGILENLVVIGVMICICLVMLAILLPLLFRFGAEKARMMILLVVLLPTALGILLSQAGISLPSESTIEKALIAFPFVAVLAFIVSFFISVSIMNRKEF